MIGRHRSWMTTLHPAAMMTPVITQIERLAGKGVTLAPQERMWLVGPAASCYPSSA